MTAWVLVLASVTAGDGGVRTGAAREPVAVRFEGRWVGTVRLNGGKPLPVDWDNTARALTVDRFEKTAARFTAGRSGGLDLALTDGVYRGTYSLNGDGLTFRVTVDADSLLFRLKPADSRKP